MVDSTARALALAARSYANSQISQSLDGLSFQTVTEEEYEALTPDSNVIYVVTDDEGKVTLYMGSAELCKSTSAVFEALAVSDVLVGTAAKAEEV